MTDKMMNELAGREADLNKRIERLETLEYETTAFPAASGLTLLCDVILTANSAAITLCPTPILPAFAHLWLIIAAWSDTREPGKMRMTLNAAVPAPGAGPYGYYVRQEHPFGAPPGLPVDTEAVSTFGVTSNSSWEICHPAGFELLAPPPESPEAAFDPPEQAINSKQNACFVQIPNYAVATSIIAGDLSQAHSDWGFAVLDILEADTAAVDSIDEGGGSQRLSGTAAAVTSVHLAPAVGETFLVASQFTLYGL